MAIVAKETGGASLPLLAEGSYTAVCVELVDLGMQFSEKYDKVQRRISLGWEVVGETVEINGEAVPRVIRKEYTTSLHEKSSLRKDLQAWRGRAFTAEELGGFDLKNILGAPCMIQIIHVTSADGSKTYDNIAAIMALPKGTKAESTLPSLYFDLEEPETMGLYEMLPKYLRERIAKAENFPGDKTADVPELDDDDMPF